MNTIFKIACFMTGHNFRLANESTVKSKHKINTLATVLVIPMITYFLIGGVMGQDTFSLNWIGTLILASFFMLLIFLVEKTIIMAPGKGFWIIALRVLLGLSIAYFGSMIIDIKILQNDIDNELQSLKGEHIASQTARLEQGVQAEKDKLVSKLDLARERFEVRQEKYENELQGKGSGRVGNGAVAKALKLQMEMAKQDFEKTQNLVGQKTTELNQRLDEERSAISYNENTLLGRHKALWNILLRDWHALILFFALSFILLVLEFLVIIVKMSYGPTDYDLTVEYIEKRGRIKKEKALEEYEKIYTSQYN